MKANTGSSTRFFFLSNENDKKHKYILIEMEKVRKCFTGQTWRTLGEVLTVTLKAEDRKKQQH